MNRYDICNMALLNIGSTRPIASFTENSTEAQACGRVYDTAKKTVLAAYPWKFATHTAALTVATTDVNGVETEMTSNKFAHVYEYPADAVRILSIGTADDVGKHPQAYEVLNISENTMQSKYIATNVQDAYVEYIIDAYEEILSSQFIEALSWKISSMIGMGLAKTAQMIQFCDQMYESKLDKAKQAQYLETEDEESKAPRYIEQRGGGWCGRR